MATSSKRLQPYHYVAIDLRQKGKTYPDIAKAVNRAPQTVTNWFNNDTVFRAEFARLTAESVELARLKIVNAMPDAADFLILLMGHEHGTTALGAVKDVLDRGGLKPVDKSEREVKGAVEIVVHYGDPDDEDDRPMAPEAAPRTATDPA